MPSLMPKPIERQLEKELNLYFEYEVEHYLDEMIQQGMKGTHPSEEREALQLINQFIANIKNTDFSSQTLQGILAPVNKWKKEFTKKILLPKYLANHYPVSLDHLALSIKKAILDAALKRKMHYYIHTCKKGLLNALLTTEPSKRLLTAKHLVATSLKDFQESDKDFPKESFLEAFDAEHLKSILQIIPYRETPQISAEEALLQHDLSTKLAAFIQKSLRIEGQGPLLLTKQLHVVNQFLIELERDPQVLATWGFKEASLTPLLKQKLFETILIEKANIFFRSYLKEIQEAKKNTPFDAFAKAREAILKKYLTHYIHNHHPHLKFIREHFLSLLKEEEKESRAGIFHQKEQQTVENLSLQKTKKMKRWKRV